MNLIPAINCNSNLAFSGFASHRLNSEVFDALVTSRGAPYRHVVTCVSSTAENELQGVDTNASPRIDELVDQISSHLASPAAIAIAQRALYIRLDRSFDNYHVTYGTSASISRGSLFTFDVMKYGVLYREWAWRPVLKRCDAALC